MRGGPELAAARAQAARTTRLVVAGVAGVIGHVCDAVIEVALGDTWDDDDEDLAELDADPGTWLRSLKFHYHPPDGPWCELEDCYWCWAAADGVTG